MGKDGGGGGGAGRGYGLNGAGKVLTNRQSCDSVICPDSGRRFNEFVLLTS